MDRGLPELIIFRALTGYGMCVPLSRLVANLQSRQCCDRVCFGFPQDLVQVTTTSFRPSDGKSCQNGCTKTNIRPILHAERRNVKDAGNQNITKHTDTMMCLISLIKNASYPMLFRFRFSNVGQVCDPAL